MELQQGEQQFYQIVAEVVNFYLALAERPLTGSEIIEQMFDLLRAIMHLKIMMFVNLDIILSPD